MAIANRKSHNYAVQLLIKSTNIPYSVELAKLMNLIINEVYIGGIYGLNTLTIAEWEDCKEEPYDSEQTCYDIILCAYKRLLKSNIIALTDNAKLLVEEYKQNNYKL